jgi:hypothetical protein
MSKRGTLRTSEEWNQIFNIRIMDPDGWDRKNYDYSFKEEKISYEEFRMRVNRSTIWLDKEKTDNLDAYTES